MLQRLLQFHPRLSIPDGESHFFIPLYKKIGKYGDLSKARNAEHLLRDIWSLKPQYYEETYLGLKFDAHRLALQFSSQGCDTFPKIINVGDKR